MRLYVGNFLLLLGCVSCTETNIHDTKQAKSETCITCHNAAYQNVQTPVHAGVVDSSGNPIFPTTCDSCHNTTAWIPTTAGHPEALFPITTGSHANPAIGCSDCHLPSLGQSANGANTDCIHCHIGAHTTPSIVTTHTTVTLAPSASSWADCKGCHPTG